MARHLESGICSTVVDRDAIRKQVPTFISRSDPKCYQPRYDEKLWGEKDFNSSMVYHKRENAKKDFPSLYIEEYPEVKIQDPVYVDKE